MTDLSSPAGVALASPGARFRKAVAQEKPLQIAGTINAYAARLAERVGFRAIYLSGGGVAAGSLGLPDLGISTLDDVLIDIRRITDVCDLPLLVDVDTGLGRRVQHRAHGEITDQVRRRRHAHRRPGAAEALRPPPEQGDRQQGRDGRSHQGRCGREDRPEFRHHGAHRLARSRRDSRPRSIARARASKRART